jgi:hypothetical protein
MSWDPDDPVNLSYMIRDILRHWNNIPLNNAQNYFHENRFYFLFIFFISEYVQLFKVYLFCPLGASTVTPETELA